MVLEFLGFLEDADCWARVLECHMECDAALEAFGRLVYRQPPRRPLADYVRAILGVVDWQRSLQRQMVQAWDFVQLWKLEEPSQHNLALPPVVLRAFLATALHWRWPRFALMVALGFTGIMRPSEYLTCERRYLILARDIQGV